MKARRVASLDLIATLTVDSMVLPAQTLGELHRVRMAKARRASRAARAAILEWSDIFVVADSTWTAFQSALGLASVPYFSGGSLRAQCARQPATGSWSIS